MFRVLGRGGGCVEVGSRRTAAHRSAAEATPGDGVCTTSGEEVKRVTAAVEAINEYARMVMLVEPVGTTQVPIRLLQELHDAWEAFKQQKVGAA